MRVWRDVGVAHDTKWQGGIYCKHQWVGWCSHSIPCCALLLSLQLSVLTEEQIRRVHFPIQKPSAVSPQIPPPVCSALQDSSRGEVDLDPYGEDQEWEQLGDVS